MTGAERETSSQNHYKLCGMPAVNYHDLTHEITSGIQYYCGGFTVHS